MVATINGSPGNDSLAGTTENDTINGLGGDDTLVGNSGDDRLDGGDGTDSLLGGDGNDTLISGFDDTVDGGSGFDTQIAPGGIAGAGIERMLLRDYLDVGTDGHGNELDNIIIDEGPGNAFLYGNAGNDTLIGGSGVNFFLFQGDPSGSSDDYGHDSADGGGGIDWLLFEGNAYPVTVDFRNGTVAGGSPVDASVTFANIEIAQGTLLDDVMFAADSGSHLRGYGGNDSLTGGAGDDTLVGDIGFDHPTVDPGNDRLFGGGGNDGINGEEGDDWIDGGAGNDELFGADGADSFVFGVAPGAPNADTINDFVSADDQIVLDDSVYANSGPSGPFTGGDARFAANSTGIAENSSDRVVYDTSTGDLWYDADGNGAGARQLIATLQGAPALAATDIGVVNGGGGAGCDSIRDWASGLDKVALDDSAFAAIGAAGEFAADDARFAAGAGFTSGRDASDRVLFDTSTGRLYYDADGSGSGTAQLVATLQSGAAVVAADIVVI